MKTKLFFNVAASAVCLIVVASLAAQSLPPRKPRAGGTDILHWNIRTGMTNESATTNATGYVVATHNQQGNANKQQLTIILSKLETNSTYQLYAALGEDPGLTYVTDITSDARGKACLRYMKVGSSNGNGLKRGKSPLPAVLDPVNNVREVVVTDMSSQAILSADLTAPDKVGYLVKRKLTEGNVIATLSLHATTTELQFRLLTWGLAPVTTYSLAANGIVLTNGISDSYGFLSFTNLPVATSDILNVHSIAVWDAANNPVIGTQLP